MSTFIHPQTMTIDGLSIRFAEAGIGPRDALLLSPWPESVFAFEQAWPRLAEVAHLVAVDLPGFGGSERRAELMNPKAMGEFIVRIADAFGLEKPHLVAPDIGTSATLFAASAHPGRFASLIVGSGGAAVPIIVSGPLKEWVEAADVEPYRQIGGRKIVEIALSTIAGYTPSDEIRADYMASYEGNKFAETVAYVQAYPSSFPFWATYCPGSPHRCALSRAARTRSCRQSTRPISVSDCRTTALTSSQAPATSVGKKSPTNTQGWSLTGGTA